MIYLIFERLLAVASSFPIFPTRLRIHDIRPVVTGDQWAALKCQKNGRFLSVRLPAGTFTKFYSQSIRRETLFIKRAAVSWTRFHCFFFGRKSANILANSIGTNEFCLDADNDSVTRRVTVAHGFSANVRWYLADFYFLGWLMNGNDLRVVEFRSIKKLITFFSGMNHVLRFSTRDPRNIFKTKFRY